MRVYLYRCIEGHQFERSGGLDQAFVDCECGSPARRRPYSSMPYLKGETVARGIPEKEYRQEAIKRDFQNSWGDASRSIETIRHNLVTDKEGNQVLDMAGMNREGS